MKKGLIIVVVMLFFGKYVSGQYSLQVEITGLKNNSGVILFQLFNENEKIINQIKGDIKDLKSLIIIKDIVPGRYGFRYFHDENMSGELEKNVLGIPKEGYGFSNDAIGPFGPKPFKEWLFELNENKILTVKARYLQKN
jgi:uncharacterized protein (DUF2141 family)